MPFGCFGCGAFVSGTFSAAGVAELIKDAKSLVALDADGATAGDVDGGEKLEGKLGKTDGDEGNADVDDTGAGASAAGFGAEGVNRLEPVDAPPKPLKPPNPANLAGADGGSGCSQIT